MGCAYIKKTDIKTKEVDLLSGEVTKAHRNEVNNNIYTSPKKVSSETFNIEKFNFRNLEKSKNNTNDKNKVKKAARKSKSLSNLNEVQFSGPIISLLKNKVDNYRNNILSNKVIIVNKPKNFNKGN